LSESTPDTESELHLAAFPPAEFIAKGEEPLWQPVSILKHTRYGRVSVAPETALPNVTGAIIDACGYLAGLNLSVGAQSLEPGVNPTVMFADELKSGLESLQLSVPGANCESAVMQQSVTKSPEQVIDQAFEDSEAEEPAVEQDKAPLESTDPVEVPVEQTDENTHQSQSNKQAAPLPIDHSARPSLWRNIPFWIPLIGVSILLVLIWKLRFYFKLGKPDIQQTAYSPNLDKTQPASDEPDTAPLQSDTDTTSAYPRSAPVNEWIIPDLSTRPEGCDAVLLIEGKLDADTEFKRFCFVNTQQISVDIGRGEADINIEHPAISRGHARIEADSENMTLSDLGSRNGTFINSVPCLPGEIMFLEPGVDVHLGDVHFRIRVVTQEAEWA
jgi:predicted component of type VI protein secretion system